MFYKSLFRKLERTLASLEATDNVVEWLEAILARIVTDFSDELGIRGGRIYARRDGVFVLETVHPPGAAPLGFRLSETYPPIAEIVERGFALHDVRDPGVDREIERALGVTVFAAIGIGDPCRQIVAFSLDDASEPEHVRHTLFTIRHAINLKLRHEKLEDRVAAVREIQMSLLPRSVPAFGDFDVWGATSPAEEVGGDLYDFIPVSARRLGIAVADSSGHGLPAALQARDAIIGLRMGVQEQLRLTATIEKLNRVVSHSALASKFISLFYGELELHGSVVYCNAGHPPPILWDGTGFAELSLGGMVLGPNPDALYDRGHCVFPPGAVLLAFTDGVSEAENPRGEPFGVGRLREIVAERPWSSARDLVEKVTAEVHRHAGEGPPVDDQTLVAVLRRRPSYDTLTR